MNRLGRKLAASALLAAFLNLFYTPAYAEVIFSGDVKTGAEISNYNPADISITRSVTNDLTNPNKVEIKILNKVGTTLEWSKLNIAKGNHLDFNFTQANQIALNKVMGGMSTIAGKLSTSGEAGRLIIFNPKGMLFENGAVVNVDAGSLFLTTKDVSWDADKNEIGFTKNNYNNAKITINDSKEFKIAEDLNIIAPKIVINSSNKDINDKYIPQEIIADRNIRLITSNGVTFTADYKLIGSNAKNSINVNNSKIVVKNNDTGKLYIASANINNSTLESSGAIDASNSTISEKSTLASKNDMSINSATITDSTINSDYRVLAEKTKIKDSFITGKNTMTFDKGSTLDHATVNLNSDKTYDSSLKYSKLNEMNIHLNDATLKNGTVVKAPKICANRITMDNSELNAINEMSLIGATLRNNSKATANAFIYDKDQKIVRDNSITNAIIENSTLTATSGNIVIRTDSDLPDKDSKYIKKDGTKLDTAKLSGAIIEAVNVALNLNEVNVAQGSAEIINAKNVKISGAKNFTVKAAAADLKAPVADLTIDNSDITIKDSNVGALNASNSGNITLEGVNAGSVNISNVQNVVIKNSDSAADASTPTIADLAQGRTPVIDYNSTKYNAAELENKITGNKYGAGQRISYISGDVNISNVSNIDIINTAITGNLNESSYTGEANLLTSFVGGVYNYDRTNGETSVYQPYIGQYVPYYMIPANVSDNSNNFKYNNDTDKTKMGSALNVVLQRQFTPKGFAASDDEIAMRINNVLSSSKSGKGNSIITTQKFIAD